ncbi:UTP--glucose-1-phosphate uridylyltransferase [Notoacmeibacter ruber]|uniref:UTP--glucose-1-phosphate uridylyltransferase n=1 Tax=Notoacmeibacter ruber TaxID=2670375 RepID=A0A3L7JA02_9HYPH|nr:UTP--glucose-1-phosphate uridylyltransferase [Notoacmeibacter ruber]RLQ87577.1 UTP--glucose-1-phosphate uridylyltransferase [Notoacmeibacter ruber]
MASDTATNRKLRKAIIPAAGFGSRMLPATKSIPKEMLPVVDRPLIHYIVAEALEAGIEHVVIVTSRQKGEIEDYFDEHFELDRTLREGGKTDLADRIKSDVPGVGSVSFVRQQRAEGLGHAIWSARQIIGDEAFAVLLPDMLKVGEKGCMSVMTQMYDKTGGNIIAVMQCDPAEAHKYGIVSLEGDGPLINAIVEKPEKGTAPSNLYVSGRYILQPEIFNILENLERGAGNEIQLTDAIVKLMDSQEVRACEFEGNVYDCGNPGGYVSANVNVAKRQGIAFDIHD